MERENKCAPIQALVATGSPPPLRMTPIESQNDTCSVKNYLTMA
jgi:hypothetical protein